MIRKSVPSANVDVILGITRNKLTNDNSILTGSIVLTGTVFEAEKIQLILDLANAVFGGNANTTPQGNNKGACAGAGMDGANPQNGANLMSPSNQMMNRPLGNRITIVNNLRLGAV